MFLEAVYLPECLDEFLNISQVLNVQKSLYRYFCHTILLIFCFCNTCEPTYASICHSAAFFSSSNINAIAANCLLEKEWSCIFGGNYRRPSITFCSGRRLNMTDSVNADHSDATKMDR